MKTRSEAEGGEAGEPGSGYQEIPDHLLAEFELSVRENLDDLDAALEQLARTPGAADPVNEIFRLIHTVKGAAGYLDIGPMSDLARAFENALEPLRKGRVSVAGAGLLDLFFKAADGLRGALDQLRDGALPDGFPALLEELGRQAEESDTEAMAAPAPASKVLAHDPMGVFLESAGQYLANLDVCLERLAVPDADEKGFLPSLVRSLNSLKASAAYMGLETVRDRVQSMQEILSGFTGDSPDREESHSRLTQIMADLRLDLQAESDPDPKATDGSPQSPETLRREAQATASFAESPRVRNPAAGREEAGAHATLRIESSTLDTFMNLVGELIVIRNSLVHLQGKVEASPSLDASLKRDLSNSCQGMRRVSESMHRAVMEMRMVPVRTLFRKFPRVVREVARKNGKSIQVELVGEDTEIDKAMAEAVSDPLLHLVRNAADHGIESAATRAAAGKQACGTIMLKAEHIGNQLVIEVCDDGAGIDRAKVLAKAVRKGMLSEAAAAMLSDEAVLQLLFEPGFSTSDTVTDISGRGVGLDVVRSGIQAVKGEVSIDSVAGEGTTLRITVPLTIAMLKAMVVRVGEAMFAIPAESIREIVRVRAERIKSMLGSEAVEFRGNVIPVVDLGRLFGMEMEPGRCAEDLPLLVLKAGETQMGFRVDALCGQEEIVVKPLGAFLSGVPGMAGASVLGDGRTILILDVAQLLAMAVGMGNASARAETRIRAEGNRSVDGQ
jgi:two-component system, chemotaxis family, sensor kinase CheA